MSPSQSAAIAFSTALFWKQIAASMARTMCFRSVAYVIPRMAARARGHQKGAKRPEKAGTNNTPWQSSASVATR